MVEPSDYIYDTNIVYNNHEITLMIAIQYWSWYWSDNDPDIIEPDIDLILKKWSIPDIEKTSFYDWKKSSSILLIDIDRYWYFSISDPQGCIAEKEDLASE